MRVDTAKNTLIDFRFRRKFFAENGANGGTNKKTGKSAADLIIPVPPGTMVRREDTGELIADLIEPGDEVVLVKGGRGGIGNAKFATSVRQTPRFATAGKTGQELAIKLELKLIADVALIGFPNAGKSTLLSVISAAKPKIADYPFTTTEPVLGVVTKGDFSFVAADIPGLIEGAAGGAGMGHDFLRHIERTRILLHLVDVSGQEGRDPYSDFTIINRELREYRPELAKRPQWVLLNKIDLADPTTIRELRSKLEQEGYPVYEISAATKEGVDKLVNNLAAAVAKLPPFFPDETKELRKVYRFEPEEKFTIVRQGERLSVKGAWIRELILSTNFSDYESRRHFQRKVDEAGLEDALRAVGMEDGDTVLLDGTEFEFTD